MVMMTLVKFGNGVAGNRKEPGTRGLSPTLYKRG